MFDNEPQGADRAPAPHSRSRILGAIAGARAGQPLRDSNRLWLTLAGLLVLLGTLASILGARAVARSHVDKERLAFHLASAEIASTLKLAIEHEEDLVVSASAFVTGNPHATPADFDRWVESVHALQRFHELQNIGLVKLVPAAQLHRFERRLEIDPVRPFGPSSQGAPGPLQIAPPGRRPYYCLAVAGLARSAASYLPAGLDYCALAPTLVPDRDSGLANYAPVLAGQAPTLGVSTPVYRGGTLPTTVAARRHAFVGWLGELLIPNVVLESALAGHPNIAVIFRYDSPASHVAFTRGAIHRHAQSTTIDVHKGWTVRSLGPPVSGGVFSTWSSVALLGGGTLFSIVVGLLMLVLGTGRTRALALVREKTRELSHQALHDALTGLPNRALVIDRAEQIIARASRRPGVLAGALFIDVDGFKHVNDSFGHAAGDELLHTVAERLLHTARGEDTVGRLGGDEFVVLLETTQQAELDALAERLTKALREPVTVEGGRRTLSLTASIGVAAGHYVTPDALLRDADLALYAAKAAGKNRYALFDLSMSTGMEDRLELETDIRDALRREEFFLVYQPIFDLHSGRVTSVEALIRWQHPTKGVIAPDQFIPMIEQNGLIVPIGRWALEEACRQAGSWGAAGARVGVSVNVSAHQLGRGEFVTHVRDALQRFAMDPSLLTLEVTETTLMRSVPAAYGHLESIRALGVRVAIDDFGTGYASLSNLQRVPIDVLKIDMSFVAALSEGERGRKLLEAVLGVGRGLNLSVVAEGVEEPAQLRTLEQMGCDMAQGFLLAMPDRPQVIERTLHSRLAQPTADRA